MSQENVKIVEAAIDAYNRQDWDAMFEAAAPGFELDMSRGLGPGRGVYGLDQVRSYSEELNTSFESIRVEPDEFIEAGDLVVVPWTVHARGREGIEVTARPTIVWTIRDGAIERVTMYQEREDALDDLGLSE